MDSKQTKRVIICPKIWSKMFCFIIIPIKYLFSDHIWCVSVESCTKSIILHEIDILHKNCVSISYYAPLEHL